MGSRAVAHDSHAIQTVSTLEVVFVRINMNGRELPFFILCYRPPQVSCNAMIICTTFSTAPLSGFLNPLLFLVLKNYFNILWQRDSVTIRRKSSECVPF